MNKLTALLGTLLISLTAAAGPSDLQIFNTLTSAGVSTNLSASSEVKILLVDSIQCRNLSDASECWIDDASSFQRSLTGNDAKLISTLLTSVFRTPAFYESADSNKLYVVRGLRCAQVKKQGSALEDQTSCYAKLSRANQKDLNWGNPLDFQTLLDNN